jgi:hypothetical protein
MPRTSGLYEARYALAAALVGGAVCYPRWTEEGERAGLLARRWRNTGGRWRTVPRRVLSAMRSVTWR